MIKSIFKFKETRWSHRFVYILFIFKMMWTLWCAKHSHTVFVLLLIRGSHSCAESPKWLVDVIIIYDMLGNPLYGQRHPAIAVGNLNKNQRFDWWNTKIINTRLRQFMDYVCFSSHLQVKKIKCMNDAVLIHIIYYINMCSALFCGKMEKKCVVYKSSYHNIVNRKI